MPRTAVCVEVVEQQGVEWRVRTPPVASPLYFSVRNAKKLKGRTFNGFVAPRFLYRMIQSLNLLPFRCVEQFVPIVLPALRGEDGGWQILENSAIRNLGFRHTANRFRIIDRALEGVHIAKPLTEKINERNKLTEQVFPPGRHLVINGAGGGISCAACLFIDDNPDIVVDQTLYWRTVATAEEAWYRVGLLNSSAISQAIRPFNPQGEFGARHLHTLPHRVIPAFDESNENHREIARLARRLSERAHALISAHQDIQAPSGGIPARRRKLRSFLRLSGETQQLETVCAAVLGTTPDEDA